MRRILNIVTWAAVLAFLAWAVRMEVLEGYLYQLPQGFPGDFKNAVDLEAWTGHEMFYGPIFVLEWHLLLQPGRITVSDLARLDFVLFGIAFVCTCLAVFDTWRPKLLVFMLAAWLASHATVALFASAQHLEALELALIAVALLCLVKQRAGWAGASLGLAIVTKTLPVVFLPYLAILRQWRALAVATLVAGCIFVFTCVFLNVSVWDGLVQLLFQGPNLTKNKATAEEYALRAFFIRLQTGGGELTPTPEQAQLANVLQAVIALATLLFTAYVLWRTSPTGQTLGLAFGMVAATMLVVTPSSHIHYFVFLLPAWTAAVAALVRLPLSGATAMVWVMLAASYVLVGFDQPFVLSSRLLGVGQEVLRHWVDLNPLGLLLCIGALGTTLLLPAARRPRAPHPVAEGAAATVHVA